eukprot:jgi/Chlat1/50/ChrspC238745S00737
MQRPSYPMSGSYVPSQPYNTPASSPNPYAATSPSSVAGSPMRYYAAGSQQQQQQPSIAVSPLQQPSGYQASPLGYYQSSSVPTSLAMNSQRPAYSLPIDDQTIVRPSFGDAAATVTSSSAQQSAATTPLASPSFFQRTASRPTMLTPSTSDPNIASPRLDSRPQSPLPKPPPPPPRPASRPASPPPPTPGTNQFHDLQQHIEDLTQEKFALLRGLEGQNAVANALAIENSSLAENYNALGKVVENLKLDAERYQAEINAQTAVLAALSAEKNEAKKLYQEAVERAQALAKENVELEDKLLKLRSSELKLRRDFDILQSQAAHSKQALDSVSAERAALRAQVEALQDEKRNLSIRLRRASLDGPLAEVSPRKPQANGTAAHAESAPKASAAIAVQTDEAEFAEDEQKMKSLEKAAEEGSARAAAAVSAAMAAAASDSVVRRLERSTSMSARSVDRLVSFRFPPTAAGLASEKPGTSGSDALAAAAEALKAGGVSQEQLRVIDSIHGLISELSSNQKRLAAALVHESNNAAQLRSAKRDLSERLENQTQRLELLVAQSITHGMPVASKASSPANDGDEEQEEVVEHIFGWLLGFLPTSRPKRRTTRSL